MLGVKGVSPELRGWVAVTSEDHMLLLLEMCPSYMRLMVRKLCPCHAVLSVPHAVADHLVTCSMTCEALALISGVWLDCIWASLSPNAYFKWD